MIRACVWGWDFIVSKGILSLSLHPQLYADLAIEKNVDMGIYNPRAVKLVGFAWYFLFQWLNKIRNKIFVHDKVELEPKEQLERQMQDEGLGTKWMVL